MAKYRSIHVQGSSKTVYEVDGVRYERLEDVPEPARSIFADADGNGVPDAVDDLHAQLGRLHEQFGHRADALRASGSGGAPVPPRPSVIPPMPDIPAAIRSVFEGGPSPEAFVERARRAADAERPASGAPAAAGSRSRSQSQDSRGQRIACSACGHDITLQPVGGRCPRCGRAVIDSIRVGGAMPSEGPSTPSTSGQPSPPARTGDAPPAAPADRPSATPVPPPPAPPRPPRRTKAPRPAAPKRPTSTTPAPQPNAPKRAARPTRTPTPTPTPASRTGAPKRPSPRPPAPRPTPTASPAPTSARPPAPSPAPAPRPTADSPLARPTTGDPMDSGESRSLLDIALPVALVIGTILLGVIGFLLLR